MKEELKKLLAQRQKRNIEDASRVPSAVLLPIYRHQGNYHIVLIKRTETVKEHKGQISFPGGVCEKEDRTLLDTALRECDEEIGLRAEDVEVLGELDDEKTTTSNYIVSPFVATIPWPYHFRMNKYEVDERMEAILAIDTTKGNRVINCKGFAISPTLKDGYILRVSEDLLDIMQIVTGTLPVVFPITTQDITPYGNEIYHLNSIMQPATATNAPVVGVAITTEVPVPGCATGANHTVDIEMAVRFVVEVAKAYGEGKCSFYD